MSNDLISVPRELLERLISATINGCGPGSPTERDAKALLAQRCTCPSGDGSLRWPCPVCPPEPVAYLCEATHESGRPAKWLQYGRKISNLWRADEVSLVPLYRHSAAQAPVVLPERKRKPSEDSDVFEDAQAEGWNACLGEFKRLNPGITEAAPPRKS